MYIVINGGGKVGSYLGRALSDKGHHVAIIEKRGKRLVLPETPRAKADA